MSESAALPPLRWRRNLGLFLVTVASVFVTGVYGAMGETASFFARQPLIEGAQFAGTLLTILVAHEFGHWITARLHKVDASLPFFIPLPLLSPFGTMGAVIRMRGTIPTRRALLDIGASGPLAGLLFAIPLYAWGAAHSHLVPVHTGGMELGGSVLLKLLDHFFAVPETAGMDLALSPIAFGAWGGLFVTMINLFPVGQLDGGHVAYALFGSKQDRFARFVHRGMLAFFFGVILVGTVSDLVTGSGFQHFRQHLANSTFWLVWFELLAILGSLSNGDRASKSLSVRFRAVVTLGLVIAASVARTGHSPLLLIAFFAGLAFLLIMEAKRGALRRNDLLDHPPTNALPLDNSRTAIAILTLLLFALLFMPQPFSM